MPAGVVVTRLVSQAVARDPPPPAAAPRSFLDMCKLRSALSPDSAFSHDLSVIDMKFQKPWYRAQETWVLVLSLALSSHVALGSFMPLIPYCQMAQLCLPPQAGELRTMLGWVGPGDGKVSGHNSFSHCFRHYV